MLLSSKPSMARQAKYQLHSRYRVHLAARQEAYK